MQFSIVITTYNRLALLKRAIDSALNQTEPCEVVVVDDASPDDTEAYLRSLVQSLQAQGHSQLTYHRNPTNQGHAQSVNIGVEKAQGEWVKLVDDDDYLDPDCIAEFSRAIALCPTAVIASCQAAQVDETGRELSRTRIVGPGQACYVPQSDIHYGMLIEQMPFGTPIQVAFQREAFLRSGGWDSLLDTNCDDIDSWIRIAQYGNAIFINRCLGYRTIWPGAYNYKFSIQQRMATNLLIKERIHALIHPDWRSVTPALADIRNYLKLHWSLVALKQKQFLPALQLLFPAALSPTAWKMLVQARKRDAAKAAIRQLVLVDSTASSVP